MGVSLISIEQACANAEQEIPDFGFDEVRAASRAQWSELLGRVQVDPKGVDSEIVDLFYSSMYRTHLSPADCEFIISRSGCYDARIDSRGIDTGENPLWNSTEPYYDSFYCNVRGDVACASAEPSLTVAQHSGTPIAHCSPSWHSTTRQHSHAL